MEETQSGVDRQAFCSIKSSGLNKREGKRGGMRCRKIEKTQRQRRKAEQENNEKERLKQMKNQNIKKTAEKEKSQKEKDREAVMSFSRTF